MKKLLFLFALVTLVASCNNDNDAPIAEEPLKYDTVLSLPETDVFVQGQSLRNSVAMTKGNYKWPDVNEAEGWESARFSLRADNTIPDFYDKSSSLYFGRAPGKVGNNKGKVYSLYPYGRYNDRDLDYYQKDKKTGSNIGLFRYVYDVNGKTTQPAIMEAPLVVDILGDEKSDLETAIAKGQNVTKNQKSLDRVNELLAMGSEYLEKHVLWYVVKEVGMKNGWHVNGVISENEVEPFIPGSVPDEVEVDVHQQEHTNWNEIKTSIHVRADVESVVVNIPIKQENIVEKDDFAIRVFDFDYSEYHITHTVAHNENGITITIENIPAELIQNLKDNFGDGLTIEIHSYCTTEDIWDDLKNSRVLTGKPCTVRGQVHSALHPETEPAAPGDPYPYPIHVDSK
jgi:hypothetical protein